MLHQRNADTDSDGTAAYSDANTDCYGHQIGDANPDRHGHSDGDQIGDTDAYAHGNPDGYCNSEWQ